MIPHPVALELEWLMEQTRDFYLESHPFFDGSPSGLSDASRVGWEAGAATTDPSSVCREPRPNFNRKEQS